MGRRWQEGRPRTDPAGGTTMHCDEARTLFNAYLDGELAPTLATELAAHRLRCPDCRRALALMEVCGHVLATDREPTSLQARFTDRLLACVERPPARRARRFRTALYVAGPLAAAAVLVMALLGVFGRRHETRVAGVRVVPEALDLNSLLESGGVESPDGGSDLSDADIWLERISRSVQTKRESGAALQRAVEWQLRQLLDAAEHGGQPASAAGADDGEMRPTGAESEAADSKPDRVP